MLIFYLCVQALSEYAIVVTAESNETKGYLYQYKSSYFGIPDFQSIEINKKTDHIMFNEKLSKIPKDTGVLYRLITQINKKFGPLIPKNQHKKTHIYFFVNLDRLTLNISQIDTYFNSLKIFANKYSKFQLHREHMQTINSEMVSIYKWIGVNHKYGVFRQSNTVYDILDIERNETRITYYVNVTNSFPGSHIINIGWKHFNIYSRKISSANSMNIHEKVLKYLRKQKYNTDELSLIESVNSPCLPYSYDGTIYGQSVWGSGKFSNCAEIIEKILINGHDFKDLETPLIQGPRKFVIAASPDIRSEYNILNPNSTLEDLSEKASMFCTQEWKFNHDSHLDCFRAAYQYVLLARGLRLNSAEVSIAPSMGSESAWPLGALLSSVVVGVDKADHVPWTFFTWLNVFAFLILFNIFRFIERYIDRISCFNKSKFWLLFD